MIIIFSNDLKEEEFFDAEEPMEPNAIFQVVSASQLPNGPTENFRMQKESLIRFFRTEEITHPHYWIRGHQAFGKREGTPDFVYVMNGKWNEQTPRDSKLYRFTVLDSHVQPLWNHLKRATSIAPGNFVRLWIETLSEGEQDDAIASELRSLPDSGFPSDNFIAPEFALYVNKDRKWECIRTEHRRYTYVYLLMLKTKSLKQLTNVTPPLASFDNRSFYISRLKLLAEYIERLHIRNIAHGNISMRNVYYLDEGFNVKVFISSECYYFALEAIRGSADVAKKRRKFFDADQRENPVNVEMACDVFAFGLIIVELLGSLETNEKNAVTRSIRLQTVMDTLNAFRNFDSCRMQFGKLLEQIFLPRPQRIKMGGVVEHMQRITRNMQI